MAFKVTSSFGFASSAWAEYSFSGAVLGTYANPTGNSATGSTTTPTILLTQLITPTGLAATFSAGSVIAYHGTQSTDSSFAEIAFASMPFAGTNFQTYVLPSGSTATFSIGTLTVTGTGVITPTGSAGTFSIGNSTIVSTYTPTGEEAEFSVGSPTVTGTATFTPTGSAGTFSIGSVVIESAYDATGSAATFSIGNTTVTGTAVINLTGSAATFSAGSLSFSIWNQVDDSASNTWSTVNKS
jgi:hypothetical protein